MKSGLYRIVEIRALYPVGTKCRVDGPTPSLQNDDSFYVKKVIPIGFDGEIYNNWEIKSSRYKFIGSIKDYIKQL